MPEAVYTSALRPFEHQFEALEKCEDEEAFAFLMEMRTGKTKVTIDDYGRLELAKKVRHFCVIAPGGVYKTWTGALQEHLSADLKQRILVHTWISGAGVAQKKRLKAFLEAAEDPNGPPCALLINVEALSSVKEARETIIRFAKSGTCYGAVDESTIIGNHESKRTEFINDELAQHFEYRRILSGLPTPRDPLSLYSQFQFLDWKILGHRSFYSFRARYAVTRKMNIDQEDKKTGEIKTRSITVVDGFRDIDHLNAKIQPKSYRRLLSQCYDLPPKTYSIREVSLTEEQKRLYAEMKTFFTTQLASGEHVVATVVIAQMIRLHQILCGHTRDEDGVWHEIKENRTSELMQLLDEFTGKAIIWCSYDHDIQKVSKALQAEYGPDSVARFWGGNKNTREDEQTKFLKNPNCRFMVATAAAGGRGRTWMNASLVVYYSNTNDLEARAQSEERPQGVGKTESVGYVDLVAPGTVDEKIIYALREKINMATAVTGDNYKEWLI
jgi:SNF2 family DNA or RNA helicase